MQNPFHQYLMASNENGEKGIVLGKISSGRSNSCAVVVVFVVVVVVVVVAVVVVVVVVVELVDEEEVVILVLGNLSPVSNGEQ